MSARRIGQSHTDQALAQLADSPADLCESVDHGLLSRRLAGYVHGRGNASPFPRKVLRPAKMLAVKDVLPDGDRRRESSKTGVSTGT